MYTFRNAWMLEGYQHVSSMMMKIKSMANIFSVLAMCQELF